MLLCTINCMTFSCEISFKVWHNISVAFSLSYSYFLKPQQSSTLTSLISLITINTMTPTSCQQINTASHNLLALHLFLQFYLLCSLSSYNWTFTCQTFKYLLSQTGVFCAWEFENLDTCWSCCLLKVLLALFFLSFFFYTRHKTLNNHENK